MKKHFWGTILPCCGIVLILGYKGVETWRGHSVLSSVRAKCHPDAARFLDGASFIGEYGPFKAFQRAGILGSQERVCITADDAQMFILSHDRRTKGSLHFAVISDIGSGRPLLDCGTLEDGKLPGFWGMYPRKGPDAGRFWYGDYDLDGKFEVKVKLSNGLLTPEEIAKHRPVREEAGKGGGQ